MPRNDVGEHAVEFLSHKGEIARICQVCPNGFKEPQSRIHGVVFRCLASIREAIRQHAPVNAPREGAQNAAGGIVAPSRQREAGQRNHCVAPPIAEPVISRDDALLIATRDDVLLRRGGQSHHKIILHWRAH